MKSTTTNDEDGGKLLAEMIRHEKRARQMMRVIRFVLIGIAGTLGGIVLVLMLLGVPVI